MIFKNMCLAAATSDSQNLVSSLLDELSQPGSTTTVVTLRRSLSERLSTPPTSSYLAEHRRAAVLFNDTMRLRQRGVRHSDARLVFSDPGSPSERITISNPIPIDRKHQRMLSPVRPRPKEPPPPPPPPPNVPHTLPDIPPRQIFPFSKNHIEEIIKPNHHSPSGVLSHQSQTVTAKQKTSSGRKIPPAPPIPIKPRPSSWSPPHLTTASADRGDTLSIVVKKEHRNSDPGPSPSLLRLHVVTTDPETSGAVHGVRFGTSPDIDQDPKSVESLGNARSVVTVSSPSVGSRSPHGIHRLEIINGDSISTLSKSRRTSILINGEDAATVSNTSFVIDNQSGCKKDNINRVTISVGGDISGSPTAYGSPVMNRSSSCTVIDTGTETRYNRSSSLTLVSSASKSTTVIPVSSDPHPQNMLLFLDHCTNVEVNGEASELVLDTSRLKGDVPKTCSNITLNGECDNTKNENSTKEVDACDTNPLHQLSCNRRPSDIVIAAAMQDSEALWDPVEAVKRNLVPHVCGKNDLDVSCELDQAENCSDDVDTISLLSEKLKEDFYVVTSTNARIPESRLSKDLIEVPDVLLEATEDEDEEECDYNSHFPIQAPRNSPSTLDASLTGVSKVDDLASDDDSDFITGKVIDDYEGSSSIKDENEECESARHLSLSLPRFILEEKDTQDDEVDVLGGKDIGEDDENIYDSIKEHIYEELPDTPPPLPLSPPPSLDDLEEGKRGSRSIFEGASKYDILSYLEGFKERGIVPEECYYSGGDSANGDEILDDKQLDPSSHERMNSLDLGDLSSRVSHLSNNSDSSEDSCNLIITNIDDEAPSDKVRKSSADIERNDSGVGSETSKSSRSRWQQQPVSISEDQQHLCEDCDQPVETQVTDSGVMFAPLVCRKCGKKRAERKETIAEIVETEEKYGRDLRIILEEFYRPMLVAGLLTAEQLAAIFLNSEELFDNSTALADKLRDNLEIAIEQGDEDLLTVDIGKLFLEAAPMLHAFESYCTRQSIYYTLLYSPSILKDSSPNTPSILKDSSPNTPSILKGSSPNTPSILKDSSPNTPSILKDSSPNTPSILKGSSPNTPSILKDSSPNTPSILKGSSPNTPSILKDSSPNTQSLLKGNTLTLLSSSHLPVRGNKVNCIKRMIVFVSLRLCGVHSLRTTTVVFQGSHCEFSHFRSMYVNLNRAAASLLLANLEKEKELLRIFLRVSQMENAVLRRMNLNSFLMVGTIAESDQVPPVAGQTVQWVYLCLQVPVQRVTKYLLLLARLYNGCTSAESDQVPPVAGQTVQWVYLCLQVPVQRVTKYLLLLARLYNGCTSAESDQVPPVAGQTVQWVYLCLQVPVQRVTKYLLLLARLYNGCTSAESDQVPPVAGQTVQWVCLCLQVPVQRVTKYPLLLARLYKVTPSHHEGRELLKQAQHKIELHLEHMNAEAKDFTSTKLWRRISIINLRRSSSEVDMINIKLRKMALDILEWNHDEARFVMEGKLLYTNPTDNNWRRGRTIKLNTINALLVTNGKPTEEYRPDLEDEVLLFPKRTGVREATLLLLKEKCGRYSLIREPLYLDKCIVCCEADWEEYFEVQELASKDTFIFKAEDGERTKAWYRQLQYHAQGLGAWRKRRNALANIMINGMLTRN
uniref:Uncharacterized protein n=2 Tax=Timema TaxID=61471 RepID=A0A7R8VID7_TIMDO|nr:unnamed protein product [Timema douglasi]